MESGDNRYATRYMSFTLVEMLLVAAIIAIIAGMVVPMVGRSMRGHRLRLGGRTIAMAGRFARSMAILNQQDMLLEIDIARSTVSVRPAARKTQTDTSANGVNLPPQIEFDIDANWNAGSETVDTAAVEGAGVGASNQANADVTRKLEGVAIKNVEFLDGSSERQVEGIVSIHYRSNGTCRPYRVEIMDNRGDAIIVEVDRLSGARVERIQ